jgi:hypothetical protein
MALWEGVAEIAGLLCLYPSSKFSEILIGLLKALINAAVSIGRCNTRSDPQVQEFQGLRMIREHKSKEKASCLGKSELQPEGSFRLKRLARSNDQRGVASTV